MDTTAVSAHCYADVDLRLRNALRDGAVDDPESWLFLILLAELPAFLAATPLLYGVSWSGRRCDLLFTDGQNLWHAVEVKAAPAIVGAGPSRKNCKTKRKRRYDKLVDQARVAASLGSQLVGTPVRAIALWYEDGAWQVIAHFASEEAPAK